MPTPGDPERSRATAGRSSAGGAPSTRRATGSSTSPPTTSCQETRVSMSTGASQRLISTKPTALTSTEPNAPARPRASIVAGVAQHQQGHADEAHQGGGRRAPARRARRSPARRWPSRRAGRWPAGSRPARRAGGRPPGRSAGRTCRCCTARARSPSTTSRRAAAGAGTPAAPARRGGPHGRGEEGAVGRQELLGDEVRRAPGDRGHRGDAGGRPVISFHGRYFSFHGR